MALVGDPAVGTRDAIGASGLQIRERDGGNGYSGQSDPRLYFGLGDEASVRRLEVRWPDGGVQAIEDPAVDRLHEVRQDPSR